MLEDNLVDKVETEKGVDVCFLDFNILKLSEVVGVPDIDPLESETDRVDDVSYIDPIKSIYIYLDHT